MKTNRVLFRVSFTANIAVSGVSVAWQTAAEVDVVGFNVWRRVGRGPWSVTDGRR